MKFFGITLLKKQKLAERQACDWFARLQSGDVSVEEFQAYLDWAERHPRQADEVAELEQLWAKLASMPVAPPASLEAPSRHPRRFERALAAWRRASAGTVAAAAAAASVVIAVSIGVSVGLDGYGTRGDVYETGRAESTVVNLADGSTAHLNVLSRMRVAYADGERRIVLSEGEAFFTVAPDRTRPFIVTVRDGEVRALGTSFNVDLVPEKQVSVTLVKGRIRVSRLANGLPAESETLNEPGQQARVRLSPVELSDSQTNRRGQLTSAIKVSKAEIDETLAWRSGKLIFDGEPLRDALAEINRHTNHTIRLSDNGVGGLPIYGIFNTGDWEGLVSAIERSYPLKAKKLRPDYTVLEPIERGS